MQVSFVQTQWFISRHISKTLEANKRAAVFSALQILIWEMSEMGYLLPIECWGLSNFIEKSWHSKKISHGGIKYHRANTATAAINSGIASLAKAVNIDITLPSILES